MSHVQGWWELHSSSCLVPKKGKEWHRLLAFPYLSFPPHNMETNCRFLIIHMSIFSHLLPEQKKWLCHKGSLLMHTLKDWQLPNLCVTDFHGNSTSLKKDICKDTSLKPCCQQANLVVLIFQAYSAQETRNPYSGTQRTICLFSFGSTMLINCKYTVAFCYYYRLCNCESWSPLSHTDPN